jgi:RNA polymerase sigma-70 factor (ECF subfamily)
MMCGASSGCSIHAKHRKRCFVAKPQGSSRGCHRITTWGAADVSIHTLAVLCLYGPRFSTTTVGEELLPFDEVYARHADSVYRFCIWLLRDASAAEDATAETFVSAFAAYERTRPDPEGLQPWLLRIAKNYVHNYQRRSRRFQRSLTNLGHSSQGQSEDVESGVVIREELRELLEALGRMRERDQMLIGLRCGAELSFREIGGILGMTELNARTATYRAIDRLRSQVGRQR